MVSRRCEPLSPAAQLFHAPSLNCYVIAHPRFTSTVKKGRKSRWIPTTVNLDNHVIVPEIDSNIEFPDRFVEDYTSNITKIPLDLSKPLWELHLLNIKTSDAEAVAIFRIHHSMGDGASLMSLLLASTRKTSDPDALPTLPAKKRVESHYGLNSVSNHTIISLFKWFFLAIWWGLVLVWHTVADLMLFVLSIFFFKDTWTPLKGAPGVELNTKRFVHRIVSLEDIKLVKNEMHMQTCIEN
ncbi:hypothetical protein RIF29_26416 [Crotalaria pallida]|uniref:diacylglycerol O-acyltransferase n=1 Tax=Crotalaria pallida TaxID=3830 RepID=A0AAN9EQ41_CROPI